MVHVAQKPPAARETLLHHPRPGLVAERSAARHECAIPRRGPPSTRGCSSPTSTRARRFYDERRYEEAERELEEAYLLRPRDQKVLNLLGLVYFKQEKYDKAEEVYRKLVTESPEAHTLFYNLGLIHYKLGRLEEAETTFLKALELNRENPKINFYLGSIYERLRRFQDAIFQYRQAGANLMVRRVEDKLAAGGRRRRRRRPRTGDTAEFKAGDHRSHPRGGRAGDGQDRRHRGVSCAQDVAARPARRSENTLPSGDKTLATRVSDQPGVARERATAQGLTRIPPSSGSPPG